MNRSLDNNIETIFLTCLPQYTSVASTLVRDVLRNGGDVMQFLPEVVQHSITGQNLTVPPSTPHRRTY
jgi:pantetheine-phosphate adenylyltransferase